MAGEIQLNGVSLATESSGTVTIGNSVTISSFPTGHVLQTISDEYAPTTHLEVSNTGGDQLGANLSVAITPASTSNKLLVHCFLPGVYGSSNVRGIYAGLLYGDFSSSETTLGSKLQITGLHAYQNLELGELRSNLHFMGVASAPATTSFSIRPYLASTGGTNIRIFHDADSTNQVGYLVVQEIKG